MARNKRTKTVVQALDAHSLLARTLLEAGSHSGADDNMEIYYSDEDSQPEEKSLGDNEGEEEDEVDDEEVVVIPSPQPTVVKKRKRSSKNKSKEFSIGVSQ
jgi:hypothetical protein